MGLRPKTKAAKKRRIRARKEQRLKTKGLDTQLFRKVQSRQQRS